MPALELDILKSIKMDNLIENYPVFIETGLYGSNYI